MPFNNNLRITARRKSNKPKRNISAFHIFSKEMHLWLNQLPEKINPNKRMAIISEKWANLSPIEKNNYTEKAKLDKWRYLNELNEFYSAANAAVETSPRCKPKKFGNAFTFYLREKKQEVHLANPELSMSDIMSLVAKMWREMTKSAKKKYTTASDADKERYKREVCEMKSISKATENQEKRRALKKERILKRTRNHLNEYSAEFIKKQNDEQEACCLSHQTEAPKIEEEIKDSRDPLGQEDNFLRNQSFESSILPKLEHKPSGYRSLTLEQMKSVRKNSLSQEAPLKILRSGNKANLLICKTPELLNEVSKTSLNNMQLSINGRENSDRNNSQILPRKAQDQEKTRNVINNVLANTLNSETTFDEFIGADPSLLAEKSFDL